MTARAEARAEALQPGHLTRRALASAATEGNVCRFSETSKLSNTAL